MDVHAARVSRYARGVSSPPSDPRLASAVLDALPFATLVVDGGLRVVHANAAARASVRAAGGAALGEALGCAEAAAGGCGGGARCAACVIRGAVARALQGESVRARGFLLRTGARGEPADLHLLASATPLELGGARHAVLVLQDADRILLDPAVVRICAGCGRVEDEEGAWHALHRYLEDRLGIALDELCDACARDGKR
jgi:hypothetical protein